MKNKEKYEEDLKRADEIARILREKTQGKSREDTADQLSSKIGLRRSSCRSLLVDYFGGPCFYISDAGDKNKKREQYTETHLHRVAVVYELLEIKVDDPLIELTKQINPAFVYPPVKPTEKPYTCIIKEKFSHKDLQLKPEQRKDLEQRALDYALQNKEIV